jgi:hypothetical protein
MSSELPETPATSPSPQAWEDVDPVVVDAVRTVSNRFGAQGLCDLIALAREELARAEEALKDLQNAED